MSEQEIKVVIIQPGRISGKYRPIEDGLLQLEKIIYPDETLPFDLGIIPYTLSEKGEPLQVILFSEISHPIHTQVNARLLGGVKENGSFPLALAVPQVDRSNSTFTSISEIDEALLKKINHKNHSSNGNTTHCVSVEEMESIIKEALLKFRMIKVENFNKETTQPAWKPIDSQRRMASYTDVDCYTSAEYTFFQLPGQIQHYVSDYLDDDERILYAVPRPSMRSQLIRSWLGREKLQAGVLILTTQRLIQLVELVPLGDSGVRYGFNASLGVLERLAGIDIKLIGDDVMNLQTYWASQQGSVRLDWESPLYTRSELMGLVGFLEKFLPEKINPITLQRVTKNNQSNIPSLNDPAATNPEISKEIHRHFSETIPSLLEPNETIHAWALWPSWFEEKGFAQVLVITGSRILIFPDPDISHNPTVDIQLGNIGTLEYVGSILHSYIGFTVVEAGISKKIQWEFPYTADGAFHNCFEAIRRCMASIPITDGDRY